MRKHKERRASLRRLSSSFLPSPYPFPPSISLPSLCPSIIGSAHRLDGSSRAVGNTTVDPRCLRALAHMVGQMDKRVKELVLQQFQV